MAESPDALVAQLLGRGAPATQVAAASALARPEKWRDLQRQADEGLLWGEISNGSALYRVACFVGEPAFSCSCPATKKPCKHGLAILLSFARSPEAFVAVTGRPPSWVSDWAAARAKRAAKKVAPRTAEIADPQAQAKRAADREARIAAGLDDLERWLGDLVRQGLAGLDARPWAFWDGPAARLVDAQAPGLARRVRSLHGVVAAQGPGAGWPERLLERLGLLYLLVQAYRRLGELPEDVRAEVRQLVGWTVGHDELLTAGPVVTDSWRVLGWRIEEDERLRSQRVWLRGAATGRFALILTFAPPAAPLDKSLYPGTTVDADLVFYPGVRAQRALVKDRRQVTAGVGVVGGVDLLAASGEYAAALADDPWLDDAPVLLGGVVPAGSILRDGAGRTVLLSRRSGREFTLAALTGGRPAVVFGEWNGRSIVPLGVGTEERYVPLDA